MTGPVLPAVQFTFNDIEVGARVVEALVRQATTEQGAPLAFADLLTLARGLHPRDAVLGRAVPVGIGAKLQFAAAFCAAHDYPNLACLAVDPATMRPGPGHQGDWEADRRAVATADWSDVPAQLDAYATKVRATVPARLKPRKERPADVAWYAWFCSHREACKWINQEDKQEIINLVMAGLDPENALRRVQAAKAGFSPAA